MASVNVYKSPKDSSDCTTAYITFLELEGDREVLNWCMNVGLISARYECPKCGEFMHLIERCDKSDGYAWRCQKTNVNPHDVSRSIRSGSLFSNSRMNICDILRVIRFWFGRCMQDFVVNEVKVSSNTVGDWYRFCREVCMVDVMNGSVTIGGEKRIVEVIGCAFGVMRHLKSVSLNGKWLFCGIERATSKLFFVPVSDKTKEEFYGVIEKWILPGSVIISDCWNMFDCLEDEDFIDLSISNNLVFKSPGKSINGQTVEPIWSGVKGFLKNASNHTEGEYDSYIGEYTWRKMHEHSMSDGVFKSFLQATLNLYNPPGKDVMA